LNVYVPHPLYRPWVHDYIEELCAAPNGAFWDQADQTSQAINHMRSKGGGFFEYLRQGAEKKRAEERKIMREDATDALYTDGIDKPTPEQVEAKARYMFGDRYVKGS
jgi:hypothetical protein